MGLTGWAAGGGSIMAWSRSRPLSPPVRPAQPGPNTLLVYVLPLEGPAAAADVPLSLAVSGQNVPLDTCSRTCRTTSLTLSGVTVNPRSGTPWIAAALLLAGGGLRLRVEMRHIGAAWGAGSTH